MSPQKKPFGLSGFYYGWIIVVVALVSTGFWMGIRACFSVFFGMGWGVTAPMFMAVAADLFKGKGFGLIYGTVEGAIGLAGALGAWAGGFIYDQTGSYQIAFILAIFFFMLSMAAVWLAAPRRAHPVGT